MRPFVWPVYMVQPNEAQLQALPSLILSPELFYCFLDSVSLRHRLPCLRIVLLLSSHAHFVRLFPNDLKSLLQPTQATSYRTPCEYLTSLSLRTSQQKTTGLQYAIMDELYQENEHAKSSVYNEESVTAFFLHCQ